MEEQPKGRPIKVKVSDKRRSTGRPEPRPEDKAKEQPNNETVMAAVEPESHEGPVVVEGGKETVGRAETSPDYLDDLRRLQAEFDNYRKRMLREQTQLTQRASARLIERLLPIIDNFESALDHGEGGSGIELVYRELRRALEEEGLEEIQAEGRPFDPTMHEAFQAVEDADAHEPIVRSVLRRGYLLKGQIIRPAMVSVARPPENAQPLDDEIRDEEPGDQGEAEASTTAEPDAAEG
ncbi:MAG: nucleotide exchange factor GrpE [Actinomycetota bacterium]|nr:nucleotide exchange factor GrpE [Actinomycetota bacterium]